MNASAPNWLLAGAQSLDVMKLKPSALNAGQASFVVEYHDEGQDDQHRQPGGEGDDLEHLVARTTAGTQVGRTRGRARRLDHEFVSGAHRCQASAASFSRW